MMTKVKPIAKGIITPMYKTTLFDKDSPNTYNGINTNAITKYVRANHLKCIAHLGYYLYDRVMRMKNNFEFTTFLN